MSKTGDRAERTVSSMQWAAWADALGWISELTTAENLRRRTKGRPLTKPYPWQRQVGGRMGVRVDLPAGCYSDDTQLRLATARSVSSRGFDVEAFARVELPVWQSYALGGGRATKAAAAGMSKSNANWATNFYKDWENSGGNGAAMRIQPHVYAAADLRSFAHLDDVIKNAVVTHGHPNALVGAVLHATALTMALAEQIAPGPDRWPELLATTRHAFRAFERCQELASYWRPQWETVVSDNLERAWTDTVLQAERMFNAAREVFDVLRVATDESASTHGYELLVKTLDLDNPQTRGSGLPTAVTAIVLAAALPDHPAKAATLAASRLNTDTDTIATMAAAIVAAIRPHELVSDVLDADYIAGEARRLTHIARREPTSDFPYPDLLRWVPPKSGLDSVGIVNENLVLAGLGWLEPISAAYNTQSANWQWMGVSNGATVLVKYRPEPLALHPNNWPALRPTDDACLSIQMVSDAPPDSSPPAQLDKTLPGPDVKTDTLTNEEISKMLAWLERQGHSEYAIGYALRRVIEIGTRTQVLEFANELAQRLKENGSQHH
ncbi:ADP-ribosylglycohydrolase family protein [Nocardia ninae]|uniref:ADP-ribosylglycohydrolase n=1 Tax=Nocardia ninae NBRC 108245 TaxID=1210091 RepID=A0A511MH89_9NOCA|nr:ADP-ribosylglycohydrolase family protein [Nocardia ninae]GEM40043.1 hypothetical protein NN4_45620 [Nocardia ninae NBRC 108245]